MWRIEAIWKFGTESTESIANGGGERESESDIGKGKARLNEQRMSTETERERERTWRNRRLFFLGSIVVDFFSFQVQYISLSQPLCFQEGELTNSCNKKKIYRVES